MQPSKRAYIMDPFHFLKTPPPQQFHKKSVSEQPIRSERENLNIHSRSFSTSQILLAAASKPKQPDTTFDDLWDSNDTKATEGCCFLSKSCRDKRFAFSASTILFLLTASIGLVSNLSLVATHSLQGPDSNGFRFHESRSPTSHKRFLFDSFHGDIKQSSNNASNERPKLVIHIGPHKTATTTTQTELTFFQDRLALDNYVYLGRLYHPYSNSERMVLNRTPDSTLQTYFRDMFQKCWKPTKVECVKDLRDLLHSQFKTFDRPMPNLLISDEALLKLYDDQKNSDRNENYIMLKEILGRDFDIVIVVTYRRFYEWLPSAKHQKDKPTGESSKTMWPGKSRTGTSPQPLFPENQTMSSIIDSWSREHFFTESTYETLREIAAPNFVVKVVHMYSKMSVRTNFLCNAIPNAAQSCRSSRREDAVLREARINTRSGEENVDIIRYPSALFDALATAAVSFIDTHKWERQKVSKMLRDHYYSASLAFNNRLYQQEASVPEDQHGSRKFATTNPWQLPIICPSLSRLDELLHHSLALESKLLPRLFRKSAIEHVNGFRYTSAKTLDYCWVDTEKALSNESPWKQHILSTFNAS